MSKDCHKSKKLDALLGKNVRIEFFDGDIDTGKLKVSPRRTGHYAIGRAGKGDLEFRKTHVKRVAEVPNGLKARYTITDEFLRGGV